MPGGPGYNCCLCWIDGVVSETVEGWEGAALCREHLADILSKYEPPVPVPSPGFAKAPATLQ